MFLKIVKLKNTLFGFRPKRRNEILHTFPLEKISFVSLFFFYWVKKSEVRIAMLSNILKKETNISDRDWTKQKQKNVPRTKLIYYLEALL